MTAYWAMNWLQIEPILLLANFPYTTRAMKKLVMQKTSRIVIIFLPFSTLFLVT